MTSGGILADIKNFFLKKPTIQTLINFKSCAERENYTQRILQRLGISVADYAVLNIHQIGINAPARYVYEELLKWDGDSTCWPNHIATVDRINGSLENIHIFLFGQEKYPFGFKKGFLGLKYIPLFDLRALRFQHVPDPSDFDNARYLLYSCRGGYPIGIFSIYVRSSIAEQNEAERTQLFLMVGFNFYGKKGWIETQLLNKIWEMIHNRITANLMNRFKQLCEWRLVKEEIASDVVCVS